MFVNLFFVFSIHQPLKFGNNCFILNLKNQFDYSFLKGWKNWMFLVTFFGFISCLLISWPFVDFINKNNYKISIKWASKLSFTLCWIYLPAMDPSISLWIFQTSPRVVFNQLVLPVQNKNYKQTAINDCSKSSKNCASNYNNHRNSAQFWRNNYPKSKPSCPKQHQPCQQIHTT